MNIAELWQKIVFVATHITLFELPLILIFTVLSAWRLSVVLSAHNARLKEAVLSRKIALFYTVLVFVAWILRQFF